jgi:hypothetical protein
MRQIPVISELNRQTAPVITEMLGSDGSVCPFYMEPDNLPENDRGCRQHWSDGVGRAKYNDFIIGGFIPSKEEDPFIRFRFECPGPGVMDRCRLQVRQFDAEGSRIDTTRAAWNRLINEILPAEADRTRVKLRTAVAVGIGAATVGAFAYRLRKAKNK